jgi:folate-dependent phosphoribosylglycinamide formyltransferase PurN
MAGYFLLTLDTEIAWGTFDVGGLERFSRHFRNYRRNVARLIQLMEKYEIRATWAFVGHLFLDSCEKIDGTTHPEVLRPISARLGGKDWHCLDPGTDISTDPFWYGKDVLDKVLSMSPPQEIGTHTFSHVILGDAECTEEIAVSQVKSHLDLAESMGLRIHSLVFPRNKIAYLGRMKELGILAYRGEEESWYRGVPALPKKLFHLFDQAAFITPPVYTIGKLSYNSGVLNVPASMFLPPADGLWSIVPMWCRKEKAMRGIRAAMEKDAIFHIWFHPFNLGSSDGLFGVLECIFSEVHSLRKKGLIDNPTMSEIHEKKKEAEQEAPGEGIAVLGSRSRHTYHLINVLSKEFKITQVIYENRPFLSRMRFILNRLRKLGAVRVLGQILFLLYDYLSIRKKDDPEVANILPGTDLPPPLPSKDVGDINSEEVLALLAKLKPRAIVVSGTGILKKGVILSAPRVVNIHCGITPEYRGVHGGFWASWQNDLDNLGVTVHLVDAGVDTGGIIFQQKVATSPHDDIHAISARQYAAGAPLVARALRDMFSGNLSTFRKSDEKGKLWYHPTLFEYLRWRRHGAQKP